MNHFRFVFEYIIGDVSSHLFSTGVERKAWLDDRCHELKHTAGAAKTILAELELFVSNIESNQPISWSLSVFCRMKKIQNLRLGMLL
jgi:hypothetical protein